MDVLASPPFNFHPAVDEGDVPASAHIDGLSVGR
jgi:hypothetical protein